MKSYKFHIIHLQCTVDDIVHIVHADTELVFCKTCCDVGVSMCTYIRIDTESHSCNFAFGCCKFVDDFKFRNRFYIEAENIVVQSEINFPVCFTYSCIYYLAWRKSSFDSRFDFSAAYTVGTKSAFADNTENLRVGICLNGIMNAEFIVFATFILYSLKSFAKQICIIIIEWSFHFAEFSDRECTFHKVFCFFIFVCSCFYKKSEWSGYINPQPFAFIL